MLNLTKLAVSAALICGVSACAASTDKAETKTAEANAAEMNATETQVAKAKAKAKLIAPMVTVKPGASVTIDSVLPKFMTSGSYQTVQLRLNEQYNSGTLSVSIEPTAGLSLFGGSSSKTFDMAQPGVHVWDVDVKSDEDGVYFLNVFADADGQSRTFSVRLNMGQTSQKMFDDAMPADGEMSDGGKIRVLEAEETIQ